MGFIKAFSGALGGTMADQWKDFYMPKQNVPATAGLFPAVAQGTNAGLGEIYKGSENIITNGSKIIVVATLNTVCTLAICAATFPGDKDSIKDAKGVIKLIITKIVVPIILKSKWINVARLALRFVPIEAKTEVIHVPIFCPNKT